MMRRFSSASMTLALFAIGASVSGCATVTRGTHEIFTVNTVPPNASVKTSNGHACDATPCSWQENHRDDFDVTISKPGYKEWHGHVTHQFSSGGGAAFAGNVIVGGGVGLIVDTASGATQKLVPNPLNVTLEPVQAAAAGGRAQTASQ